MARQARLSRRSGARPRLPDLAAGPPAVAAVPRLPPPRPGPTALHPAASELRTPASTPPRPSNLHFGRACGGPRAAAPARADGVTRASACGCVLIRSQEGRREGCRAVCGGSSEEKTGRPGARPWPPPAVPAPTRLPFGSHAGRLSRRLLRVAGLAFPGTAFALCLAPPSALPLSPSLLPSLPSPSSPPLVSRDEVRAGGAAAAAAAVEVTEAVAAAAARSAVSAPVRPKSR